MTIHVRVTVIIRIRYPGLYGTVLHGYDAPALAQYVDSQEHESRETRLIYSSNIK